MRHLLILSCLAFVTAAVAAEADFDFKSLGAKKALRDYKKAVAKDEKATELKRKELDKEAANLVKTTRDAFVESLKGALKQAMQAGNLDEANKISDAIKALKSSNAMARSHASQSKQVALRLGKKSVLKFWTSVSTEYKSDSAPFVAELLPNGVVRGKKGTDMQNARWEQNGNTIQFIWDKNNPINIIHLSLLTGRLPLAGYGRDSRNEFKYPVTAFLIGK